MDAYYTSKFADTYTLAGKIFNKEPEAAAFIDYFQTKLQYIQTALKDIPKKTVYFEYKKAGLLLFPVIIFSTCLNMRRQTIFSKQPKVLKSTLKP